MVTFGPTPHSNAFTSFSAFDERRCVIWPEKFKNNCAQNPNVYITCTQPHTYGWSKTLFYRTLTSFLIAKTMSDYFFSQTTKCNSSHLTSFFKWKWWVPFVLPNVTVEVKLDCWLLIATVDPRRTHSSIFYRTLTSFLIAKTISDCFFVKPQSV